MTEALHWQLLDGVGYCFVLPDPRTLQSYLEPYTPEGVSLPETWTPTSCFVALDWLIRWLLPTFQVGNAPSRFSRIPSLVGPGGSTPTHPLRCLTTLLEPYLTRPGNTSFGGSALAQPRNNRSHRYHLLYRYLENFQTQHWSREDETRFQLRQVFQAAQTALDSIMKHTSAKYEPRTQWDLYHAVAAMMWQCSPTQDGLEDVAKHHARTNQDVIWSRRNTPAPPWALIPMGYPTADTESLVRRAVMGYGELYYELYYQFRREYLQEPSDDWATLDTLSA